MLHVSPSMRKIFTLALAAGLLSLFALLQDSLAPRTEDGTPVSAHLRLRIDPNSDIRILTGVAGGNIAQAAEATPANGALALSGGLVTSYDPAPAPNAPAGVYSVIATFENVSGDPLQDIFFEIAVLTGGNLVLNCDGGPGGAGCHVSVESSALGEDGALSPGETFQAMFQIGLAVMEPFDFFVNVLASAVPTDAPLEGVLLEGDPGTPAIAAFFKLPPHAAPPEHIVDGVILSRLAVWFDPEATVGEVNDALATVAGRIVSMTVDVAFATVAVPPQANVVELQALADTLALQPSVIFAFVGRTPEPKELPPGTDAEDTLSLFDLQFLLPTRFPAAWNARAKAESSCSGSPLNVLVADNFDASKEPTDFSTQLPGFTLFDPDNASSMDGAHGYQVAGALTALFDSPVPTGANPLQNCLNVIGINIAGLSWEDAVQRITDQLPASGRFVLNMSLGFRDEVDCILAPGEFLCPDSDYQSQIDSPIARAELALLWKMLTDPRQADFLAVVAASNEANKSATIVYPGLGESAYSSMLTVAATADPLFGFVQDAALWDPFPAPLSSLVASSADMADMQDLIALYGMQSTVANNVLVVGATTDGSNFEADIADLEEADFSDRNPDVMAIGVNVVVAGESIVSGTSLSSPQVAGLASYLMSFNLSITAAQARQAIVANARDGATATNVIDAYATVLSLDAVALPTAVNAPIRNAILDVNNDGIFTLSDIGQFLDHFRDPVTQVPVSPTDKDWSRFDLNGDGFTGGSTTTSFDLDRVGSTQYGESAFGVAEQQIQGVTANFDELTATDLDILCYYSYSDLIFGPAADQEARDELLAPFCVGLELQTVFPATLAAGADTILVVRAVTPDGGSGVMGQPGLRIELNVTGGTVDNLVGLTDADGFFSTQARLSSTSEQITIDIIARDGVGGLVLAEATVTAVLAVSFSGQYSGTIFGFDGQDEPPHADSGAPANVSVTQTGDSLSIAYGTVFNLCRRFFTGTLLPDGSYSGEQTGWAGSASCRSTRVPVPPYTIVVIFTEGTMAGRMNRADHPTLPSWDEFTLTRDG